MVPGSSFMENMEKEHVAGGSRSVTSPQAATAVRMLNGALVDSDATAVESRCGGPAVCGMFLALEKCERNSNVRIMESGDCS